MLRGDLLPVSLGGIFVSLGHEPAPPEFFARPSTGPRIAARLHDYVEAEDWPIFMNQCCNGLLLLEGCVVNPTTRRCVRLPPCPPDASRLDARFGWRQEYLAFDPTVSPHYQVLLIHAYLDDKALEGSQSEWPPSPYSIPVYSSRTGAWEARPFVREEGPPQGPSPACGPPRSLYFAMLFAGTMRCTCTAKVILLCGKHTCLFNLIALFKQSV